MPQINTTSDIGFRTEGYCRGKLLEEGQMANMVFERFGQASTQPKNASLVAKWRRIHNLPVSKAKAPLAEGVTPSGTKLTFEDIQGTLEQIGDWVPLTDVILDTLEDNKNNQLLDKLMQLCGRQAAEAKEERRADVLKAGSNVRYAGGVVTTRATVAAAATKDDFRSINRFFQRNRALKLTKIIRASANYGTSAIAPAYIAVMHPDLEDTIRDLSGFVEYEKYAQDSRLPGEFGSIEGFRCCAHDVVRPWLAAGSSGTTTFLSNGARAGASDSYDVYPIICLAEDGYGTVPLQGMENVQVMVHNPKSLPGDELAQKGHVSWKGWDLTVRLNESRIMRLECCAKAL